VPPDVQVVVPRAESHKPPQQIRWTCHPGRILSAAKLEHTSEPPGIRRESASQQHQEFVVPPDVQVVVPKAEAHNPYTSCVLITTNGAVNTSVVVHGWMVLKSACTAHLHMIYAFVSPNNDACVVPYLQSQSVGYVIVSAHRLSRDNRQIQLYGKHVFDPWPCADTGVSL
jgi:hypothetical protein